MPPVRKIDLLPRELRLWLQDELKERGFAGYEDLAESLNFRLAEEGLELTIGKSALHSYGQEFQTFAKMQEQASDEIRGFLEKASLKDEVDVTSALFQQLTTIQWRLQMMMATTDELPDPRGMKDLTSALNNLIRSTSLRDGILKAERAAQVEKLETAVEAGDIEAEAARKAKEIMGFG
ncbi:phage protein Gp27 family protein [Halocynthiibacter namhaensis]|uniref:phage protein Gp27 family protein n=1 Tax=Halocynthiibacter namhaensis TaxID=1290553 RepID=UPI00057948EC|nr:phage protein Gp27 family protein [Halocynthiibacter namhaensis]